MDDFIDSIFNAIKEIWIGIIIIILGYLAWRFNLTKDILAFVSVVGVLVGVSQCRSVFVGVSVLLCRSVFYLYFFKSY